MVGVWGIVSKRCLGCSQEWCVDSCNMGLCNIVLQHEVMVQDKWQNNWPNDLVAVSVFIHKVINKMCICLLHIAFYTSGPQ